MKLSRIDFLIEYKSRRFDVLISIRISKYQLRIRTNLFFTEPHRPLTINNVIIFKLMNTLEVLKVV